MSFHKADEINSNLKIILTVAANYSALQNLELFSSYTIEGNLDSANS
jgi:hypothetical protein